MSEKEMQLRIRCQFNAYCKKVIIKKAKELKKNNAKRWNSTCFIDDLPLYEQERILRENSREEYQSCYTINEKTVSRDDLQEIIQSLPANKREVVLLYYFEGFNDAEIGKILNLSRRLVTYRRNSALKIMQKRIGEYQQ